MRFKKTKESKGLLEEVERQLAEGQAIVDHLLEVKIKSGQLLGEVERQIFAARKVLDELLILKAKALIINAE